MDDDVMTIENTPEMRSFIQLWMMSGGMVLSTVNQILEDGRTIELPAIPGRDFKSEIVALSESFNKIVSRLKLWKSQPGATYADGVSRYL